MRGLGTYQNVIFALVAAWAVAVLLILVIYLIASWWFRAKPDDWTDL